ncbi:hypothetical protein CF68_03060 [Cupriavidus sp. SK-4]|nr:hypothetical protein CF68_03060 [Cupriavidus sp. SK-4]
MGHRQQWLAGCARGFQAGNHAGQEGPGLGERGHGAAEAGACFGKVHADAQRDAGHAAARGEQHVHHRARVRNGVRQVLAEVGPGDDQVRREAAFRPDDLQAHGGGVNRRAAAQVFRVGGIERAACDEGGLDPVHAEGVGAAGERIHYQPGAPVGHGIGSARAALVAGRPDRDDAVAGVLQGLADRGDARCGAAVVIGQQDIERVRGAGRGGECRGRDTEASEPQAGGKSKHGNLSPFSGA